MYCRECGHQVNQGAEFCFNCGVRPLNGGRYCSNCGAGTKENQEMCTDCRQVLWNSSERPYAGFWIRFLAYTLDSIILGVPIGLLVGVLTFFTYMSVESAYSQGMVDQNSVTMIDLMPLILWLLSGVISIAYFAGMHASKWQATLGKKIVGIKVTDLNGRRISFWRGVGRFFSLYISCLTLYIGFLMAGFTEKKQSLHDMICSTLVVKR